MAKSEELNSIAFYIYNCDNLDIVIADLNSVMRNILHNRDKFLQQVLCTGLITCTLYVNLKKMPVVTKVRSFFCNL